MFKNYLTVEEAKKARDEHYNKCEWFKYIRLQSGEFRFVRISDYFLSHRDMVGEGEEAISAGKIKLKPTKFCFDAYGSDSLGIGWEEEDERLLEDAFLVPAVSDYDF